MDRFPASIHTFTVNICKYFCGEVPNVDSSIHVNMILCGKLLASPDALEVMFVTESVGYMSVQVWGSGEPCVLIKHPDANLANNLHGYEVTCLHFCLQSLNSLTVNFSHY